MNQEFSPADIIPLWISMPIYHMGMNKKHLVAAVQRHSLTQLTWSSWSKYKYVRVVKSWMRWTGHIVRMRDIRHSFKLMFGKSERKRTLWTLRCRCEDNIKIYLTEIGLQHMDGTHLAQCKERWRVLVKTVITLEFHKSGECLYQQNILSTSHDGLRSRCQLMV
jgi:hypothetical protein